MVYLHLETQVTHSQTRVSCALLLYKRRDYNQLCSVFDSRGFILLACTECRGSPAGHRLRRLVERAYYHYKTAGETLRAPHANCHLCTHAPLTLITSVRSKFGLIPEICTATLDTSMPDLISLAPPANHVESALYATQILGFLTCTTSLGLE